MEKEQMTQEGVTWHMSMAGKWHAYRAERSVCEMASVHAAARHGLPAEGVPNGARCYWCRRALGLPRRPTTILRRENRTGQVLSGTIEEKVPLIIRQQSDHERHEEMAVEFVGGPFDGTRLHLHIVRDGPNQIRVLESGYTAPRS